MNSELERMIMNAVDLPTIPIVATKVMQLINVEGTTAEEVARVVASDPAVTARVLKMTNLSFCGCQCEIKSLPHAIMFLGFKTVKSLVVAASLQQVCNPFGLTENMLWEHSFGAGLAARIIANMTRQADEEEAFLGGLFHDVGKNIMNVLDNRQFQTAMQISYNDNISFSEAECQVYSYTHAEVGALVIKKWQFPDILANAALKHHTFDFAVDEDPYQSNLTCIVGLANMFCCKAGIGVREPYKGMDLLQTLPAQILGLNQNMMDAMLECFNVTFEQDKSLFY